MSEAQMVERFEDMSRLGRLRLIAQVDGDIIVAVVPDPNAPSWQSECVEFCTRAGGGKSSHTRAALAELFRAMERDNQESPQYRKSEADHAAEGRG